MSRRIRPCLALLLLVLSLSGCDALPPVPSALGGLPRAHALEGGAALQEINRLHGKSVGALDGFVAHYEGGGAIAMLYVSRAYLAPVARWQLSRMVRRMEGGERKGEGPFFHLRAREQEGVTLYSALGLGQVHYFYRSGATVVWLAADPPVARRALADTLRLLR